MSNKKVIISLISIVAIIFALRLSYLNVDIINIDEAISAVIANSIVDGGVPYKDAMDHRSPLTYYAYAAVFAFFGKNNMAAVHVFFIFLIAFEALLIYELGRIIADKRSGLFAALMFAIFSWVSRPGDMWAAHTEWLVILFSILAMLFFIKSQKDNDSKKLVLTGAFFGLSGLSKQIGVLDFASVLLVLAIIEFGFNRDLRTLIKKYVFISIGFLIPILLCFMYFYSRGAHEDLIFYAWTYNQKYYLPELSYIERLTRMPYHLITFFKTRYLLLVLYTLGIVCAFKAIAKEKGEKTFLMILLISWNVFSILGASWSGRHFQHYFIQIVPSTILIGVVGWDFILSKFGDYKRILLVIIMGGLIIPVGQTIHKYYPTHFQEADKGQFEIAEHIYQNSEENDPMFVWGFYTRVYVHANRPHATRYTICTILTGLIPWTNSDPSIDTSYAIPPQVWDQFMKELNKTPPKFIVDTSASSKLAFSKYPFEKFPRLKQFVAASYQLDPSYPGNQETDGMKLYIRR